MSNDLISRSAFIEKIKLHLSRNFLGECTPNSEISVGELSTILKSVPTAYDVDAVCNEIAKYRQVAPEWVLREIILAVKMGGKND